MLDFKRPMPGDRDTADKLYRYSRNMSLEYNFGTVFLWQNAYDIRIAVYDDMIYTGTFLNEPSFLVPCGFGDIKESIEKLSEFVHSEGKKLNFYSVTEEQRRLLEKLYPKRFEFTEDRDAADYIYTFEGLSELHGKKLASKRNHINRFLEEYPDAAYESICMSNIGEIYDMHEKWCSEADYTRDGLTDESEMVRLAIRSFGEMNFTGGAIRAGGRIVAFSIGEPLNDDTFLVHIEKAFHEINGAYAFINREFVRHCCSDYLYINREDDNGDNGLRKAKLSYGPHIVLKKFTAAEG